MPSRSLMQPPLLLLSAGGFLAVATEVLPIGLLPLMAADLGVSGSAIGLLVSAYAAVVVFASIPLNSWTSKLPRKPLLVGLLIGYGASNLVVCLADSYAVALTGRLLAGACHALFFAVLFGYASRLAPRGRLGGAVALVNAGNAVAIAGGVPLSTWLGATVGWRWAFACAAGLAFLLALGAARLMPPSPGSSLSGGAQLRVVLREKSLHRVIAAVIVLVTAQFALYTFITPLLLESGFTRDTVGLALLAYGAAGVLGLSLLARFTDSHLRRGLLVSVAVMAAAVVLIALLGGTPGWTLVLVVVWGIFFGPVPSYVQTAAMNSAPSQPETVSAIHNSTFNIGISAGAFIGAQTVLVAPPSGIGYVSAALMLVALVVVLTGHKDGFPPATTLNFRRFGRKNP
ncbi:MFS transporter [Arthrobacter sp. H5]|uniref:MFS transporter n=1 Tax=Arthrobacter sp. H5 TaxID=1267973 RepID=UPI0004BA9359|nr:MFS transporter [Arthrobacter sp. H5]